MLKRIYEKQVRYSGVEMLKILAILMIVICHSLPTISDNVSANYPYCFDIHKATYHVNELTLIGLNYLGQLGNAIFMISSSIFLRKSKRCNKRKICSMWIDTEVISLLFFLLIKFSFNNVGIKEQCKSIFPITFEAYWYISSYLFIYAIHGLLNIVLDTIDRRMLLKINVITMVLYGIISFLIPYSGDYYYSNNLVSFIVIYFWTEYISKYTRISLLSDRKLKILVGGGIFAIIIEIILTNYVSLGIGIFSNQMLHWLKVTNPIIAFCGICGFEIAKRKDKIIPKINHLSSLSLLIYLIHANPMYSIYIRPLYFRILYEMNPSMYWDNVILYCIALAMLQFVGSVFLAYIYNTLFHNIKWVITDKMYNIFRVIFRKMDDFMIKK